MNLFREWGIFKWRLFATQFFPNAKKIPLDAYLMFPLVRLLINTGDDELGSLFSLTPTLFINPLLFLLET